MGDVTDIVRVIKYNKCLFFTLKALVFWNAWALKRITCTTYIGTVRRSKGRRRDSNKGKDRRLGDVIKIRGLDSRTRAIILDFCRLNVAF